MFKKRLVLQIPLLLFLSSIMLGCGSGWNIYLPNFKYALTYSPENIEAWESVSFSIEPLGFANLSDILYTDWTVDGKSLWGDSTSAAGSFAPGRYSIEAVIHEESRDRLLGVNIVINSISNTPPHAFFTVSEVLPSAGIEVYFDASSSYDNEGDIAQFIWDFGDGETASGVTVLHTYSKEGSYEVELSITDKEGKMDFAKMSLNVGGAAE